MVCANEILAVVNEMGKANGGMSSTDEDMYYNTEAGGGGGEWYCMFLCSSNGITGHMILPEKEKQHTKLMKFAHNPPNLFGWIGLERKENGRTS